MTDLEEWYFKWESENSGEFVHRLRPVKNVV